MILLDVGATVPLTGFGNLLAKGVISEVKDSGFIGAFIGGIKAAAAGITAAIFFRIYCVISFKTKNQKTIIYMSTNLKIVLFLIDFKFTYVKIKYIYIQRRIKK